MQKLFAAGCIVLVLTGLAHLLGHYSMVTARGDTDAERQMLELMRIRHDLGAGFVRSRMDIVAGFSLGFSVFTIGLGLLGLVILRHGGATPGLLRAIVTVYAGVFGVMTAVGMRYWFLAPLAMLATALASFVGALALGARQRTRAS
jgi:hypothetical protein